MAKLGWVVEANTRRDGCDAGERHWRNAKREAQAWMLSLLKEHADDPQYWVLVRREAIEDSKHGVGYYDSGKS